jgi:hypothetical protein
MHDNHERNTMKKILIALTAPVLALTGLLASGTASASTAPDAALKCHTWPSNRNPADGSTVSIRVRTAPHASVTTAAHYKTTTHVKHGTAGDMGHKDIPYDISDATPGFKVVVDVTTSRNGVKGHCSTAFTPTS